MQIDKARTIPKGAKVTCLTRTGRSLRGVVADEAHHTAPENKTPAQILYVWMSVRIAGVVELWPSSRVVA